MIRAPNLTQVTEYYKNNTVSKQNSTEKTKDAQANAAKIKSSEDKLSSKAQKYLETLRKDNADFDFIIADKGDDFRGLVDQSDKEFTVVFSSAELERMASDEKYAREKLSTVKTAVEMSDKINEQFGFERAWGTTDNSGTVLNKLTMSFDDDGKMTLFADLEKITEKQQEWLEELKNMGKTIVIVSHDVEFCALFADKCGLIFDRNIESYTDSHSFFAGNIFFTTDTNRIMSDFFKDCVTCDEAVEAIHRCLEDNR